LWELFSGVASIANPDSNVTAITDIELGEHVFVWTVSNGFCTSSDTVVVTRFEQPIVNAGTDTSICARDLPIVLPITVQGASAWTWNLIAGTGSVDDPNSTSPEFSGLSKTLNTFVLSAANGLCSDVDTLNILVYSDEDAFCQSQEVYIPTGFSPIGDGIFDLFVICIKVINNLLPLFIEVLVHSFELTNPVAELAIKLFCLLLLQLLHLPLKTLDKG
jgi:hypothetical protein